MTYKQLEAQLRNLIEQYETEGLKPMTVDADEKAKFDRAMFRLADFVRVYSDQIKVVPKPRKPRANKN